MQNGIRLRNPKRVYDFFERMARGRDRLRGSGLNTMKLIPYKGAKKYRRVKVDSIPFIGFGRKLRKEVKHHKDGSLVTIWYRACHKPTPEQIKKAHRAVVVLKIPRQRYTGRLIDVFKTNGKLYTLIGSVLERDHENNKHKQNFRMMNLDNGNVFMCQVEEFPYVQRTRRKKAKKKIRKKVKP